MNFDHLIKIQLQIFVRPHCGLH